MIIGEVVETKKAFKASQKDEDGNQLPIGSIEVRIGGHGTNLGQVRNIYARPAVWNRRVPLIGEQVTLMLAPVNDYTTDGITSQGFIYFMPINATDDVTLHQFPQLYTRSQDKTLPAPGHRLADKKQTGYTFPKSPKIDKPLQPFEGDDIFQGRLGQSIRFGSSVVGNLGVYDEKPTWKGSSNGDPIMLLRVKIPEGGTPGKVGGKFQSTAKYGIEDLSKDNASIYLLTSQLLSGFKAGFNKNIDVKTIPSTQKKGQVLIDSERVIINSNNDKTFIIGKDEVIITGKRVLFQGNKYKVYLDELMDFLKKWLEQDANLASAKNMYSTPAGPTGPATNMAQFIQLQTADFQKFKLP